MFSPFMKLKSNIDRQWRCHRGGGTGETNPPTSRQDQFSNSSKVDEMILGFGVRYLRKILKWVWQPNCVICLGRDPHNLPSLRWLAQPLFIGRIFFSKVVISPFSWIELLLSKIPSCPPAEGRINYWPVKGVSIMRSLKTNKFYLEVLWLHLQCYLSCLHYLMFIARYFYDWAIRCVHVLSIYLNRIFRSFIFIKNLLFS